MQQHAQGIEGNLGSRVVACFRGSKKALTQRSHELQSWVFKSHASNRTRTNIHALSLTVTDLRVRFGFRIPGILQGFLAWLRATLPLAWDGLNDAARKR
jgi:hypothetical protein